MWARTCQECGNIQAAKEPESGILTNSYANAKCRRCKSEALDYGSGSFERTEHGTIKKIKLVDDDEDDLIVL